MSDLIQELYIEGDTCVFCGHELEDNKFVCSDENREFFNEAASLFLLKNFIPIDILDILENLQWSVCHRCFEDYEAKIIDKIPIEKLPLFINTVKTEKGKLAFKRKLGYKKDIIEFKLQ